MPRFTFLFLLLLLSPAALAQVQVRVLLQELPVTELQIAEGHSGLVDGVPRFRTSLPLSWPLAASGDTLLVDGSPVGSSLSFETDSGFVWWDSRRYRGALTFLARDSQLFVLNSLDVEDYLRGVVPAEMQASWPAEALRAQAIAARSYVLNSLQPGSDWDICATTHCQVYSGTVLEHPQSDQAIADTRGLVLTYGGTFARTYYHSDSGGMLASSSEVWGEDLPYLQARSDVAADTPHRLWSQQLSPQQLAAALAGAGFSIGTPQSMTISAVTASGRVDRLVIQGSAGTAVLDRNQATSLLRGLGVKSTRVRMSGPLSVSGDGWGHGVGMSQYGARSLAQAGHAFDEILAFYYPLTQLSRLTFLGQLD